MLDFLKNLSVSLRATGPAAVVIAWIAAMTTLGVSDGENVPFVIGLVGTSILPILGALGSRRDDD